jgi:DNA primase
MDVDEVRTAVAQAAKRGAAGTSGAGAPSAQRPVHREDETTNAPTRAPDPVLPRPDLRDPVLGAEGRLLQVLLQFPNHVPDKSFAELSEASFTHPVFVAMFRAVQDAGTPSQASGDWMEKVTAAAPNAVQQLVRELAVAPLPVRGSDNIGAFAEDLVRGTRQRQLLRRKAELYSRLQRADAAGDAAARAAVNAELMAVQREEHALRGS